MQLNRDQRGSPFAVVAGADLNGLGVVRSLAKAGVPTIILDTNLGKSTLSTRFGSKVLVAALSGKSFIDALIQVAETLRQKPVLILTQEDSVATVSTERQQLADYFHFSMPSKDTMQMLMNKCSFQRFAEDLQFPIPRSLHLTPDTDHQSISGLLLLSLCHQAAGQECRIQPQVRQGL